MSKIIKKDNDKTKSFKSFINFAMNFDDTFEEEDGEFEEVSFEEVSDEKADDFLEIPEEEDKSEQDEDILNLLITTQVKEAQLLEKARSESQNEALIIIEEAKKEAEEIKARAYTVGFDSGKQEGFKKGKQEAKEIAQKEARIEIDELKYNVAREIKLLEVEKEKILEDHIEDLKDIAISIGEKIALTSLKTSKDVIEKMILEATEKMKKSSWAKVYIGYTEEAVKIKGDTEFLEKLSRLADNVKVIIMQADEEGMCIIETPNGTMDISVKTQINNIKDIVKTAK